MSNFDNDNLYFLEICKKEIEKKLNWSQSETWNQRDYLDLINLIEKDTGTSLSLSTIKRIWNKNHHAKPQKSTLDALAAFLGFKDWLDFKSNYGKSEVKETTIPKSGKSKKTIGIAALVIIVLPILAFVAINNTDFKGKLNHQVGFTSKNTVAGTVPNTVIFEFDLKGISADSFFIQQSWNELEKVKINPKDSILTTTYYYPGPHEAKLFADDKIIARTNLTIPTNDWIALLKKDNTDTVPTYLNIDSFNEGGIMTVHPSQVLENQNPLNPDVILSYYLVKDFDNLDEDNFRIRLRIKNEKILKTNCPKVHIGILGSKNPCFIPLTKPGCVGEIDLRIGDRLFDGKHADLSAFGIDIFEWHTLEFVKTNKEYSFRINDELVFSTKEEDSIGDVEGIMINFSGLGSVDYVRVDNPETSASSYADEFSAAKLTDEKYQ